MLLRIKKKSKLGVSVIIGYIILVTVGVIMGGLVYAWMRTYVPTSPLQCPDGVSMMIVAYDYDCGAKELSLTLKNNGRFDLVGYHIRATNSPEQELAAIDLSKYYKGTSHAPEGVDAVVFEYTTEDYNPFKINDEKEEIFDLTKSDTTPPDTFGPFNGEVASVEIVPIRYQTEESRERPISCDNSIISQEIECTPQV